MKYWSVRGRLNRRQSYRGGRGPTEETQRCRNNRGIERDARIKLRRKNRRCGGWWGGKTEREGTNGKIVTRELKQREREGLCPSVRRSTGARISHLHRNKLAGTIGSSVHSDTANTVQPCSPNRKPLQYALLTLSTQRGPYHRPDVIFCMSYNNFVPGNVFVNRGSHARAVQGCVRPHGPRRVVCSTSHAHVRAMEKSLAISRSRAIAAWF